MEENEDNEAVLTAEIPKDELYSMKLRFLGGNAQQARREFQVPMSYKDKKTKEM